MERCEHWQLRDPEELRGRWREEFPGYRELRLELGCGKGRFTCEQARREDGMMLLAVERVADAMVVAMERARDEQVENVRFMEKDAAGLRDIFAPGEISRIYINFPDPWRKTRQYKRRLTAPDFLALYADLLPEGGQVWFKTDNDPLFAFSLEQFEQEGWELREVTHDLHANGPIGVMTDYEAKFYDQGITINRCVAVKTEDTKCDLYPGTSTGCAPV